jgi:hypothetical protein
MAIRCPEQTDAFRRLLQLSAETHALLTEAMEHDGGDADSALRAALKVWLDFWAEKAAECRSPPN